MGYSFKLLAKDVLLQKKLALSPSEIWTCTKELGLAEKVGTTGKPPWQTIGDQLYTDIKDNKDTAFYQASKRPIKFHLR